MATPLIAFLNKLSQDQLRTTNMFELQVTSGYSDIDSALEPITMYGEGFQLPDRQIAAVQAPFKGYNFQIPTVVNMTQQHTMNVRADSAGEIRRAFLAWQAKSCDPAISDGSVLGGDRRMNVKGVIRVQLLDDDMVTPAETYKMIGVFITNVGGLQVSNQNASISTFQVGFASQYWEIEHAARGSFQGQK